MVGPLLIVGVGGLAAAGVTLGVIASIDKEETIDEKVNTALIRVGYVSEGIVMGSIVAIPTAFLVLVTLEMVMRLKNKAGV
tara:strand:+ start:328 stop:570 length:243 start_codon:yes stop_codon:yes gene_type:complete